jgi:hypothetical protein
MDRIAEVGWHYFCHLDNFGSTQPFGGLAGFFPGHMTKRGERTPAVVQFATLQRPWD